MKKVAPDSRDAQSRWKVANLVHLPKCILEPTDTKKGATFCQGMNEMVNGAKGELR